MPKITWKHIKQATRMQRLAAPFLTASSAREPLPAPSKPARATVWLARVVFCVVILANLAGGGAVWLSRTQSIAQSANHDLPARLAKIETLIAQPNLLAPGVLGQLATELAAAEQDLSTLQNTSSTLAELGIGPSSDTARAVRLGLALVQCGQGLVEVAQLVRPGLASLADSVLGGPGGEARADDAPLTVTEIYAAQKASKGATLAWQQALSEWGALKEGTPDLPSPALRTLVQGMGALLHSLSLAVAATSALLDWSNPLLGLKDPQNVLLIEQNPDVLRPTGGAITHYAVLTMAHGRLAADIQFRSVAALDCPKPTCALSPLPPIATWFPLTNTPVRLGDANLDPDLTVSGYSIYNHFVREGGPPVTGIIVTTRHLFADLLGAIGPITIPGVPGPFTADNLEERMRAPGGRGDLDTLVLNAIVTKLKSATSAQRSALRDVLLHALLTKDLQLFTSADRVRDSLAGMNLNGQVLAPAGDSLEIVDTNLDGQPINASIAETATDTVTLDANGSALHALTLTYQYAKPTSLVSPPAYSDIVRVIVPNGAVGENIAKSCAPVQATQAFHRVLACAFTLAPGASVTLHFSWQVPHAWSNNGSAHHSYTLLLQRQPGASLGARVAVRAPAGRSFAAATAPGRLTSGQLTFEATPLLTDTTLQASF